MLTRSMQVKGVVRNSFQGIKSLYLCHSFRHCRESSPPVNPFISFHPPSYVPLYLVCCPHSWVRELTQPMCGWVGNHTSEKSLSEAAFKDDSDSAPLNKSQHLFRAFLLSLPLLLWVSGMKHPFRFQLVLFLLLSVISWKTNDSFYHNNSRLSVQSTAENMRIYAQKTWDGFK